MTKVDFGPFLGVEAELISPAGWPCRRCRKPVKKLAVVVPCLVPRLIFHACECAAVCTWEDEAQPTRRSWRPLVELARQTGARLLGFNGGRDTPPGFQGVN
jgi:hypothetical protein